jgi:hypothetical protein
MREAIQVYLETTEADSHEPYPTFVGLQRLEIAQ